MRFFRISWLHKDVSIAEVAERLEGQYFYKVIIKKILSLLEEGIVNSLVKVVVQGSSWYNNP